MLINKKYLFKIFMFFIFPILSYGNNITLDEMLNMIDIKNYDREIYDLEKEKNISKEKFYNLDLYNGIKSEADIKYDYDKDKYDTTGKLIYGDFYVNVSKNKISKEIDDGDSEIIYGINKNLKNMVYSKSDSELKKLKYTKLKDKFSYLDELENKKIDLINLYEEYKNNEFETKLKSNNLSKLKAEEKILKKSYELGAIPKIDLQTLQVSRENLEIELKILDRNLKKIKDRFLYEFNIDISNKILADIQIKQIDISKYISNIGERKLQSLDLDRKITEENINYLSYSNKVPDISLGVERKKETHNNTNSENRVFLKFSKDLFYYDVNLENEKITLAQQNINHKKESEKNISMQLKIQENYNNFYRNYIINKNKANLENNKYEIMKKKYTLGNITYVEVMDVFEDYLKFEVEAEKAKNLFNGYIYEIMIRGEKNHE